LLAFFPHGAVSPLVSFTPFGRQAKFALDSAMA